MSTVCKRMMSIEAAIDEDLIPLALQLGLVEKQFGKYRMTREGKEAFEALMKEDPYVA